jgi:hypothetical protein
VPASGHLQRPIWVHLATSAYATAISVRDSNSGRGGAGLVGSLSAHSRHRHLIDHLVGARGKEREIYGCARSASAVAVAMYFE